MENIRPKCQNIRIYGKLKRWTAKNKEKLTERKTANQHSDQRLTKNEYQKENIPSCLKKSNCANNKVRSTCKILMQIFTIVILIKTKLLTYMYMYVTNEKI